MGRVLKNKIDMFGFGAFQLVWELRTPLGGKDCVTQSRCHKSMSDGWMEEESYEYGNGTVGDTN